MMFAGVLGDRGTIVLMRRSHCINSLRTEEYIACFNISFVALTLKPHVWAPEKGLCSFLGKVGPQSARLGPLFFLNSLVCGLVSSKAQHGEHFLENVIFSLLKFLSIFPMETTKVLN